MLHVDPPVEQRAFRSENISSDLVIVGGGLAGVCAAIVAARAGITVTLIQDRPVLGGNASSEVRMWAVGATSHMSNNNRWAREGGVFNEILLDNLHRNPEGNSLIFDSILLEKVVEEPKIRLLLNSVVMTVNKADADTISSVIAFCSQNSTMYEVSAPIFCDASGDGVVGFLAGAAFRMGAEPTEEFGELFAPSEEYGSLLGHTLYFYSKDAGKPIKYTPPSFALKEITKIPRYRNFSDKLHGNHLWWVEYGGRLDTVHDTEAIKWELWRIVYGIWNHIKNSGQFPEAENLTLEWVGTIPGKRESRRFEGPYMLIQQDIIEQRHHDDDVAVGGWSVDLHPADGVYSTRPGCDQWHPRGVYPIPYRCMYSRNIRNLFLAGRVMSLSHVAFGSVRVMATLAHAAQAVGMAAAQCIQNKLLPADISDPDQMRILQRDLLRQGQYIPGLRLQDSEDRVQSATLSASSALKLSSLPADGPLHRLDKSRAQLVPVGVGPVPSVSFTLDVDAPTTLEIQLRSTERRGNFTPDCVLGTRQIALDAGTNQIVSADFDVTLYENTYLFFCLMQNDKVSVRCSETRITGLLSLVHKRTQEAITNDVQQGQTDDIWFKGAQPSLKAIGVDGFEMWCPERRPNGHNLAMTFTVPIALYEPENVKNGFTRPTTAPNAWVAALDDPQPALTLQWQAPQTIRQIDLAFDADYDHGLEHLLMQHPERAMPFCVKHYRIKNGHGHTLIEVDDNHQALNTLHLNPPVTTDQLLIQVVESNGATPAALFEVRCY